jgi:hypothetical protein
MTLRQENDDLPPAGHIQLLLVRTQILMPAQTPTMRVGQVARVLICLHQLLAPSLAGIAPAQLGLCIWMMKKAATVSFSMRESVDHRIHPAASKPHCQFMS